MEFYSAIKKNEILSFISKWMELETLFWAWLARLRRQKKNHIFSLNVDFRSTNAATFLDLGHMTRGEHIREVWE
jgi:hypothetical protein